MNTILEMASKKTKGGRRYIKMALLTIHDNEEDKQGNGLHWNETYVLNNIDSAVNMPICCTFTDETKTVPLDHGYTGNMEDDNGNIIPIFENSEVVGTIEKATIQTLNINGSDKKVLVGEGYLFNQRYPNFVKWLKENMETSTIKSSIELVGTEENDNHIIYDGEATNEYRVPMEFNFSGTAILSVKEADENAVILEAASLNKNNNEESEGNKMDEKTLALITDSVKVAVSETNSKNAEYEAKIAELNQIITEKDNKITELNASVAELEKAIADVNAEMDEARTKLDGAWDEKAALEKLLGEARAKERIGELNEAIKDFTEEQKGFAKDEIEKFNADPVNVEINTVVDAIYRGIGKQTVSEKNTVDVELNSASNDGDIYGEIFTVQSNKTNTTDEGSIY
jgi:exonuclease VII small subunit